MGSEKILKEIQAMAFNTIGTGSATASTKTDRNHTLQKKSSNNSSNLSNFGEASCEIVEDNEQNFPSEGEGSATEKENVEGRRKAARKRAPSTYAGPALVSTLQKKMEEAEEKEKRQPATSQAANLDTPSHSQRLSTESICSKADQRKKSPTSEHGTPA